MYKTNEITINLLKIENKKKLCLCASKNFTIQYILANNRIEIKRQ